MVRAIPNEIFSVGNDVGYIKGKEYELCNWQTGLLLKVRMGLPNYL